MAPEQPPVVLYHFEISPVALKIKNILAVKGILHNRVDVGWILPRPALSEQLGITYRRIPVLAIGKDVYCDSSLIAPVLERRFPASRGHATLFPPRKGSDKADIGLVKALCAYYFDRVVFHLGTECIPYEAIPKEFAVDRKDYFTPGTPLSPEKLLANRPKVKSALASHLNWLEQQLADGREWLLDTDTPGLVDFNAHMVYAWLHDAMFYDIQDIYDSTKIPKTLVWLDRLVACVQKHAETGKGAFENIQGEDAAKLITSATAEDLSVIGFDETEAKRLSVKAGEIVTVTPQDTGLIPTIGKLLALNQEEVVIEVKGAAGTTYCHFPRLMFSVAPHSA